jgi:hypothetical protein
MKQSHRSSLNSRPTGHGSLVQEKTPKTTCGVAALLTLIRPTQSTKGANWAQLTVREEEIIWFVLALDPTVKDAKML